MDEQTEAPGPHTNYVPGHCSRETHSINAVKAYYHLGVAYEQSGWNNKAIEQYEEFLDIWRDADPGTEELEDAKRRLAALREI